MSVVALIDYTKSRGIAFVSDFIGTLITWEKSVIRGFRQELIFNLGGRYSEKEYLMNILKKLCLLAKMGKC